MKKLFLVIGIFIFPVKFTNAQNIDYSKNLQIVSDTIISQELNQFMYKKLAIKYHDFNIIPLLKELEPTSCNDSIIIFGGGRNKLYVNIFLKKVFEKKLNKIKDGYSIYSKTMISSINCYKHTPLTKIPDSAFNDLNSPLICKYLNAPKGKKKLAFSNNLLEKYSCVYTVVNKGRFYIYMRGGEKEKKYEVV
jgi:hypothetical protein